MFQNETYIWSFENEALNDGWEINLKCEIRNIMQDERKQYSNIRDNLSNSHVRCNIQFCIFQILLSLHILTF